MKAEAIAKIEALSISAHAPQAIGTEFKDGTQRYAIAGKVVEIRAPQPDPIIVRTLQGLVDYLATNRDDLDLDTLTVHVATHGTVDVISPTRADERRLHHLRASEPDVSLTFAQFVGRFMPLEDFVVGAQRHFRSTATRAALLRSVGTITSTSDAKVEDDGVTQQVSKRVGIERQARESLPNPIHLVPRRSFAEIELAEVPFVLRVRDQGGVPHVALFECDGGAWMIDAAEKISAFIEHRWRSRGSEYVVAPIPFAILR